MGISGNGVLGIVRIGNLECHRNGFTLVRLLVLCFLRWQVSGVLGILFRLLIVLGQYRHCILNLLISRCPGYIHLEGNGSRFHCGDRQLSIFGGGSYHLLRWFLYCNSRTFPKVDHFHCRHIQLDCLQGRFSGLRFRRVLCRRSGSITVHRTGFHLWPLGRSTVCCGCLHRFRRNLVRVCLICLRTGGFYLRFHCLCLRNLVSLCKCPHRHTGSQQQHNQCKGYSLFQTLLHAFTSLGNFPRQFPFLHWKRLMLFFTAFSLSQKTMQSQHRYQIIGYILQ